MPQAEKRGLCTDVPARVAPRGAHAWPQRGGGARAFNPLTERLRRIGVDEAALAGLDAGIVEVRSIAVGGQIVREGKATARLHILLEGWACRYTRVARGRQTLAFLLPGDICDLDTLHAALLEYGVAAITPCKVAVLRSDDVRRAAAAHPSVAAALLGFAFEDQAALVRRAASLGRRSARGRLAHLICELHERTIAAGIDAEGSYLLPATQDDMADILGLTNVHVSRTLKALRDEGLIRLDTRCVTILDLAALAHIADFTPAAPSNMPEVR
ncbi:Crp/Fnr family transcriptional regulator [Sphingoaurantiacus capsulatus]|uniref:Crp/Fnr family transcriptional regulator n=1 Tax=Sphingoaurantiacus capsulatus TaxID=1771310 RepID=A0ABV7X7X2_9SPHN